VKKVLFLFAFLFMIFAFNTAAADDIINVGLYYGNGVLQVADLSSDEGLTSPDFEELGTEITAKFNSDDNTIELYEYGTDDMLFKTETETPISICGTDEITKLNNKRYRGVITLHPTNDGITIINEVNIEHYLYGVVPKEASASWPGEALKAQAVAARTYVFSALNGKHSDYGFDVCSTTDCQVYGGYDSEAASTNKAVDDTAGIIAIYDGKPVHTLFSAGNGGWAEDSKNVWGGTYPYLTTFKDEYEDSDNIKGLVWTVSVTPEEIAKGIAKYGGDVGDVTGMSIIEKSESGRILKLKIIGTKGSFIIEKDKARSFLGLRSSLYTITPPTPLLTAATALGTTEISSPAYALTANGIKKVSSTMYVITSEKIQKVSASNGDTYTLNGRGYGHGVGMSQWGAYCMSEEGFTYDEILKYYYKNITLGTTEDLK